MNMADRIDAFKKWATKKETVSVSLVVLFVLISLYSMFISPSLYQGNIQAGDVALKDTYAPYDFMYEWGMDAVGTDKAREAAVEAVPYILYRDSETEDGIKSRINDFFKAIREEKAREVSIAEQTAALEGFSGREISERNIRAILEHDDLDQLQKSALDVVDKIFLLGYIDASSSDQLKDRNAEKVDIFSERTGGRLPRSSKDLLSEGDVQEKVRIILQESYPSEWKTRQAVEAVVTGYVKPNLKLDDDRTLKEREKAGREVRPVYNKWEVKKNELIVEKGTRINDRHIAQLSEISSIFRPGRSPKFLLGALLLFLMLGIIAFVHSAFTQKKHFLRQTKEIGIVLLNMLFIVVVADVILRSTHPAYFIPLASIAMILTLMVGFNIAFLSVVLMSLLISVMAAGKVELALLMMVGSVVGMFAIKGARRRASILWAGLFIGLAKLLTVLCISLINNGDMELFIRDATWAFVSGIMSGIIVMGLLPLFEHFFKIPTNISLIEMSDLNHPILKKLALEAPGTYHHCIMVGNLAEAACDSVGANSLLARVGAYYHDIGKISKAEYFSENEMGAKSKHSKLTPQMSALIISKHVKEGVEIANKYKLNNAIISFISQHHGDSLIAYFYQKAIEQSENGKVADKASFRYPGPKPQTKESAIIMLADSVEASSRSLDEPTPGRIRGLVKKIVNNKFIDGQLDDCDLTLKDMHKIAESFVRVLMGVFHTRLSYPEDEKKGQESVSEAAAKKGNGKKKEKTDTSNGDKNKHRKPKQQEKDKPGKDG